LRLFDAPSDWREFGTMDIGVPPTRPGEAGRIAQVNVKAGRVCIAKPRHGAKIDPVTVTLTYVEVSEINPPKGHKSITWRLLTTLPVAGEPDEFAAAQEVVRLYRLRWRIDIDQAWRLSRIKRRVGSTCTEAFWVEHQSRPNPRGRSASDSWSTRSRHSSMASRRSASALSARLAGRLSRHS